MSNNHSKKSRSKAQKSNWKSLPSRRESDEELRGDLQELQNHSQFGEKGVGNYIKNLWQSVRWGLAQSSTNTQSTHLKLKEGVTPVEKNDEGQKEYRNLLFEKARVSFYGSLLAGTMGITMNCLGFGMMYFGKTDVGFPTAVGGFGLEACSYFVYKVSQDANDRLDSYFGNGGCEDEDTGESES